MKKRKKRKTENFLDKRDEYRAYLTTPLWKNIRDKAIEHYGCICNRCGEYGNDVHHKTYARVGGMEQLEDLEILCRECHDAHHLIDKTSSRRGKKGRTKRSMPLRGALNYLSDKHREVLEEEFGVWFRTRARDQDAQGGKIRKRIRELMGLDYLTDVKQGTIKPKGHRRKSV